MPASRDISTNSIKKTRSTYTSTCDEFQWTPMYHWEPFYLKRRGTSCLSFSIRLILIGCLGSFVLGYNLSLLNTSIKIIGSEFLFCGTYLGTSSWSFHSEFGCNLDANGCKKACINHTDIHMPNLFCYGGEHDILCKMYSWYSAGLQSSFFLGGIIGSYQGITFIQNGRRSGMIRVFIIFLIGMITCIMSNSYSGMLWGRSIIGYGGGIASIICPIYISELSQVHKQHKFQIFHFIAMSFGMLLPNILGLLLVQPDATNNEWSSTLFQRIWWRFMFGIGILPTIIGTFLLQLIYTFDTPYYYIEHHRLKDAAALYQLMYNTKDIHHILQTAIDTVKCRKQEFKQQQQFSFNETFMPDDLRSMFFIGIILCIFQQCSGFYVFITSSEKLFTVDRSGKTTTTLISLGMTVIHCLFYLIPIVGIDIIGKHWLLFIGSALQCLCLLPATFLYLYQSTTKQFNSLTQFLSIIAVLGYSGASSIGTVPFLLDVIQDIYPIKAKKIASTFITSFYWISACIIVFIANIIDNSIMFPMFALMQCLSAIIIFIFSRRKNKQVASRQTHSDFLKNNMSHLNQHC